VVVICPKCKVRLKVADEKIAPEGTRFKCPKCSTVLLVKRPVPRIKPLAEDRVLAAHEDPSILERLKTILSSQGYRVITAIDGIAAMVNATRELPFLSVLSVSLPKIYGFEICKRLKDRPETRAMKVILISSTYDRKRYRREPASLHEADDYIEEHQIEDALIKKINALKGIPETEAPAPQEEAGKVPGETATFRMTEQEATKPAAEIPQQPAAAMPSGDSKDIERAKRLSRTILADIYLYSKQKVEDSIRHDTFQRTFASELKEGRKLYESRVSSEVKKLGDFYNDAINNFIEQRKKELLRIS
jgi:predicted Zn finger-like uncharacterized protein